MSGLYFEELEVGSVHAGPGATVTEEAIIRFALEWDFQPFHVDVRAATQSVFGGLVSSGIHSLALSYRLFREQALLAGTGIAGLGIDKLRWHGPVRPGDTIRVETRIVSTRPSSSQPDRGIVVFEIAARDQNDAMVMTYELAALVRRRPPLTPSDA
jgi:acyl dehydratase